jgi:hypothetical protein
LKSRDFQEFYGFVHLDLVTAAVDANERRDRADLCFGGLGRFLLRAACCGHK